MAVFAEMLVCSREMYHTYDETIEHWVEGKGEGKDKGKETEKGKEGK